MFSRACATAALVGLCTLCGLAFGAEPASQRCDVGPVTKIYGDTPWLVYSCNNEKTEGNVTVALVSAPGSPAMPFVFFFYVKDGGYRLYGEGTGSKDATSAALAELRNLTESQIAGLIDETRKPGKSTER